MRPSPTILMLLRAAQCVGADGVQPSAGRQRETVFQTELRNVLTQRHAGLVVLLKADYDACRCISLWKWLATRADSRGVVVRVKSTGA